MSSQRGGGVRQSGTQDCIGYDEQAVVAAATHRDKDAFRILYEHNFHTVYRYVSARVSTHDAEDLTAEVFCVAWAKLDTFVWDGTPIAAWLTTIAKNLMRSLARRESRRDAVQTAGAEGFDVTPATDERAMARTDNEAIIDALAKMSSPNRQVLQARFLRERNVREAADELGCSEENIRIRTYRGLRELRALTRGILDE